MQVKKIKLCFENLETCILKVNMFKYLTLSDISVRKYINCSQYENGEMIENKVCNYFYIEINKEGLKQKCWQKTLEEKLKENNIASVVIYYDNNTEEEIYVKWGENDYINEYQKTTYTLDGNIRIEIKVNT